MRTAPIERPDRVRLKALPPLALYVHIPWCVRKCPYCDFNSHERAGELPEKAYVEKLLLDLEGQLPSVWGRRAAGTSAGTRGRSRPARAPGEAARRDRPRVPAE